MVVVLAGMVYLCMRETGGGAYANEGRRCWRNTAHSEFENSARRAVSCPTVVRSVST